MERGRRFDNEPKLNIKKVIAVIVAIAVIIMFVIAIKSLLEKEVVEKVKTGYFTVYENNKWGVIDGKGEYVINPAYDEMIVIPDSTQALFICTYDVNYELGTYKTKVINEKEEILFKDYNKVFPIENYDESGNLWYEKNILVISKDGKLGLANYKGQELLRCEYDNIEAIKNITNSLLVTKDGKYGLASSTGDLIIEAKYKEIKSYGENYSAGYIVVSEEGKYGVIDNNKKVIFEPTFEDIKPLHGNNIYVVKQEGKWKVINSNKEELFGYTFDDIIEINTDNIIIKKDSKYGAITYTGETIIEPEYTGLKYAYSDKYIAKKEDKYGMINAKKETVLEFEYITLAYLKAEDFVQAEKELTETMILDKEKLEPKITGIISEINLEKGYIRVRTDSTYKYYNFKFEEKASKDILIENNIFLSIKNGKYGFVDSDNNVVVDYIYDDATEQNSYGYAAVKKDGKWGSINGKGETVLEPSVNLDNNFVINFIGKWHLAEELNMNYYIK